MRVPAGRYQGKGGSFFMGALDDIRIYNTALTDAQGLSIYTDESSL